jgi:hypothetical protein
MSHSCRSPASAARCCGSIVPVVLSAPNTGLCQPHEQTAWTPPSPTSRMVVWWSTAVSSSQVNDRAGLDPRGFQPGQLAGVVRLRPRHDVARPRRGSRSPRRLAHPRRRSHHGRLAGFVLNQNVCGDHVPSTHPFRTIQPLLRSWCGCEPTAVLATMGSLREFLRCRARRAARSRRRRWRARSGVTRPAVVIAAVSPPAASLDGDGNRGSGLPPGMPMVGGDHRPFPGAEVR